MIAVCDHNSAGNAAAVMKAAAGTPLTVLPGIEICTSEEVHVVSIFPDVEAALEVQKVCYSSLSIRNDPEVFGMQVYLDHEGNVLKFEDRLLTAATGLSLEEAVSAVVQRGGLVILAHVDREAYGILGQLGFIPEGLPYDAIEVAQAGKLDFVKAFVPESTVWLASSDAHYTNEIGGKYSLFEAEDVSFRSLAAAIRNKNVRGVLP